MSDFDRMAEAGKRKPTVHAMLNDLDQTDRRLMAIDHHINSQNGELAREIEALRRPRRNSDGPGDDQRAERECPGGLGAASWAGLKAWSGWLDLKRFELTHDAADAACPGQRPDRDRRPARAPQARGDRRRHRYLTD